MKNILLAVFSTSYVMAANPLENQAHHYMTVHDKYGVYHKNDLVSYSGGSGRKIKFFKLTENHNVTYISDRKKLKVEFVGCANQAEKIEILSVAKYNTFIFEGCTEDFFKTNIIFKRNPYAYYINDNEMSLKLIIKDCQSIPDENFFKNLTHKWDGHNIQICGKGI